MKKKEGRDAEKQSASREKKREKALIRQKTIATQKDNGERIRGWSRDERRVVRIGKEDDIESGKRPQSTGSTEGKEQTERRKTSH